MPGKAAKIRLTEKQLVVLEELSRSRMEAVGSDPAGDDHGVGVGGVEERRDRSSSGSQPPAGGGLAAALAGFVGGTVRMGVPRAASIAGGPLGSLVRRTATGGTGEGDSRTGVAARGVGV